MQYKKNDITNRKSSKTNEKSYPSQMTLLDVH
jgi:hypothetical protein